MLTRREREGGTERERGREKQGRTKGHTVKEQGSSGVSSSSYNNANPILLGPHPVTLRNPDSVLGSASKCNHTGRLELQYRNFGAHHSVCNNGCTGLSVGAHQPWQRAVQWTKELRCQLDHPVPPLATTAGHAPPPPRQG